MHKLSERGVVHLLVPLILLLGIIGGVFLVTNGNPLKLFSKAGGGWLVVKDLNGMPYPMEGTVIKIKSASVKLEFYAPYGLKPTNSVSGPTKVYTVSYKIAENPTDLTAAQVVTMTKDPTQIDWTFKDPNPGQKFIWGEFAQSDGTTIRNSAEINLLSTTSGFGKAIRITNSDGKGSNRIEIFNQDVAGLNQLNKITIEAWVKPNPLNRNGLILLKSKGSGNNPSDFQYYMSMRDSGHVMSCFRITTTAGSMCAAVVLGTSYQNSGWYHLAMVFDQGIFRTFINGKRSGTQTINGALLDNSLTGTLYIVGTLDNISSRNTDYKGFNGDIDELRFSNNARYANDFTPPTQPFNNDSNTLALWHYDGKFADEVNNKSGQVVGNIQFVDSTIGGSTPSPTPTPTSSYQRVFVTSTNYDGNLGDANGADQKCQDRAKTSNLGGIWKAWISNNRESASNRLEHSTRPYKRLDGAVVADNWNDLIDGTLQNPINVTELRTTKSSQSRVWTNTGNNGALDSTDVNKNCYSWNNNGFSFAGTQGAIATTAWSSISVTSCNTFNALYCFEQTSANSSPTPTSSPPPSPSPSPTPTPAPDSCNGVGDVNQDGKINSTDSLIVLRINAGYIKPTDEQKRRGDVNGDGKVNSTDSLLILRYDAGYIKTFPVCVVKRVFVTSSGSDGNLKSSGSKFGLGTATSGLDGADKICQGLATIAKLGGTWKAWLSDGTTSASSRIKHNAGPYKLLNGTVVANNWNDLTDGTLQSKINITETGQVKQNSIGDGPYVWTNTSASGGILSTTRTCNNWTNMNIRREADAMVGKYSSTDAGWTNQGTDGILCIDNFSTTGLAIYCFEQ